MIKQIQARELLKIDEYVREPVDVFSKKLNDSDSKRIIVTGGRGIGKSVVLYNTEQKSVGLDIDRQTIFMGFESIIIFPEENSLIFNKEFIEHYYEVQFCLRLLYYIKRNYPLMYNNYFIKYEKTLYSIADDTYDYINNAFLGSTFNKYVKPLDIAQDILNQIKHHLGDGLISLAIDRFDWTNGRSKMAQEIISKYFEMFDKVIITSDDESLNERRSDLMGKGYSFVDIDYSQDEIVIKEIIRRRIEKHNANLGKNELVFPIDAITDELYNYLISQTNGDINCMLDSIREVISDWQWEQGELDINKTFAKEVEIQKRKKLELKQMNATPPKLYL